MQKLNNKVYLSATDLTNFAECRHLTWLDRLNLDAPMDSVEDDAQSVLVQQKGFAHEANYFNAVKQDFPSWIEIENSGDLKLREQATRNAIDAGVGLIFQGLLKRDNLIGTADFIVRVPGDTLQYELVDTKLAKATKPKFILQLCFYSDLLSDVTGSLPKYMHVELGHGKRETFKVEDYFYFYKSLLARFLEYVASYPQSEPPYPIPCNHCNLCRWREKCSEKRIADDHLSAVANITRQQIIRLEAADIKTVEQLASLPTTLSIPKLSDQTLAKLREQARLQVEERNTGQPRVELLELSTDEIRGFNRLPIPSEGDLFFDMEGNPLEDGGLEYLFGVFFFENGEQQYKSFWAHDRNQEKQAFVDLIDFVFDKIKAHPSLHIYHYAAYENSAIKRLMTSHGVKEAEVDQLLRDGRLVDLYKVVREAIRISKDSYSIKAVESFYAEKRSADVKKATDSIVVYEQWKDTQEQSLLDSIQQYNEDDCRSTWQLRQWLLTLRPVDAQWFTSACAQLASLGKSSLNKSDATIRHEKMLDDYYQKLIIKPENPNIQAELAELVFHLLDFHRRADKPGWWATFDRKEAEFEELLEDSEVIAGLFSPTLVLTENGNEAYRYHYPEQEFKVKVGDAAIRLDNLQGVDILALDETARSVDLKINDAPEYLSISIGKPLNNNVIRQAVVEFANSICTSSEKYKAVIDFLQRKIPDIKGTPAGQPLINMAGNLLSETTRVSFLLVNSYLFIQGPPGAGKTYTGSHLIADLLARGKRIAVSSNSHKAIINLLEAVDKRASEKGLSYFGMKKVGSDGKGSIESKFIQNEESVDRIISIKPDLVAGTAWLLARKEFREEFDYLFLDEAGQISLANTVAMGLCAKNIVLLGDQMQLGQPIQGSHPGRSGESALEYLLNGQATIPPEQGIFLDITYRMHPNVCSFISNAFYDGRLLAHASTEKQSLILNENAHPVLLPTGIRYVPISHDGCSQKSEEEADFVLELFLNLLTQKYRNKNGEILDIDIQDILVVAPYNMQVNLLKRVLPEGARVGTVDKFQGQEAEVVIVSMATSSQEYMPRDIGFLFSKNRLNVSLSRAKCLSIVVCSKEILNSSASTVLNMSLINTFCLLGNTEGFDK